MKSTKMEVWECPAVIAAGKIAAEHLKFHRKMMSGGMAKYKVECFSRGACIFTETVEATDEHEAKHMVNKMALDQGLFPVHFEAVEEK
jgi:hypothetical protein